MTTPTQDGLGEASALATSSIAKAITTSLTNDIIIAYIATTETGAAAKTVSSVAGGSLTWTKYVSQAGTTAGGNGRNLEVWWALATGTLSAVTITATLSGNATEATIIVHGLHGANLTTPFDVNASSPSMVTNFTASATVPSILLSTNNANTLFIGVISNNAAPFTEGSGYTLTQTSSATLFNSQLERRPFTSVQTDTAVNWIESKTGWNFIVFAVQDDTITPIAAIAQTLPGAITTAMSGLAGMIGTIAQTLPGAITTAMSGTVGAIDPPTPDDDTDALNAYYWMW
jgi:hypothetical protein